MDARAIAARIVNDALYERAGLLPPRDFDLWMLAVRDPERARQWVRERKDHIEAMRASLPRMDHALRRPVTHKDGR